MNDGVDYSSRTSGPVCQICGHNEQVMKAEHTVRPSLRGTKHLIKLPYKRTYKGWWCHNHNPAEFVSDL